MKRACPSGENNENALHVPAKKPWIEDEKEVVASSSTTSKEENPFSFPFQPYPTQLKLMSDLFDILENGKVGILESPTGTGKTLTSLCAVLSFVESENQKLKDFVSANRKKAAKLKKGNGDEDFDKALENFQESEKYRELADTEEEKLLRTEKRLEEARKRLQAYKFQEEIEIEDCGLPREPQAAPELLKVVFSSRTHSQLEQLTFELKRTRFQPRVVSLGSRALLCINSEVKNLPNSAAADKCKDLRNGGKCPFYKRAKVTLLADYILDGSTRDLRDVIRESKNINSCGYYASREALPFCELIFVPYATLFDAEMRRSSGLSIDDKTIVVVDEAHNLFATLTEMSSSTIDLAAISKGLIILQKFLDAKVERTKGIDFKNLKLFENALKQAETLLSGPHFLRKDEKHFAVYKFMDELFKGEGFRLIQAIEHAKKANLLSRIYSFYRSPGYHKKSEDITQPKKGFQSFLSRKTDDANKIEAKVEEDSLPPEKQGSFPLFLIADFFIALCAAGNNFQVIVDVTSNPRKFQLLCLNGGEKFASIVSKAKSTLLIGGTMRPTDLVTSLLTKDCGIERERITDNSYDHIIDATNLRIVSIEKDSTGPLTFTHACLKDKTIFTRLLESLHPFIKAVSNGLAVFFPSKAFLATFLAHIKQQKSQFYNDLISRGLFIEGETDVWEKYSKKAKVQKATLFAVIGGKFSEGVNFSDELARCVVIIGLPYPNMMTPEFRAKTEYLRHHFSGSEIASNLAMNICMTQVNQAIGRVVRHQSDYGIVVLMDSRYSEPRHSTLISKWAQPSFSKCQTSQNAITLLKDFRGILV